MTYILNNNNEIGEATQG